MKTGMNLFKIWLDILMTVLLVLMFDKAVLGLPFHEIGGIAVCVLFIVHKYVNAAWIKSVAANLFGKGTTKRAKTQFVIDVLLLFAMVTILVTGLLISKSVVVTLQSLFTGGGGSGGAANGEANAASAMPKLLHFFASAVAIVLVGIHVGLHWSWIRSVVRNPAATVRTWHPVGVMLSLFFLVVLIGVGFYTLYSGSWVRWIEAPFRSVSAAAGSGGGGQMGGFAGHGAGGVAGTGGGNFNHAAPEISLLKVGQVIISWIGVITLFGFLSYLVDVFFKRVSRKKG